MKRRYLPGDNLAKIAGGTIRPPPLSILFGDDSGASESFITILGILSFFDKIPKIAIIELQWTLYEIHTRLGQVARRLPLQDGIL